MAIPPHDGPPVAGNYQASGAARQYNAPGGSITVNQFVRTAGVRRRPWLAPPQAAGFIDRPALTGRLLHLLCADDSGAIAVTGVHGTGGFGKTTAVLWLCHQPQIRKRFPGGLLWVTLGEHIRAAELASRVNDLAEQLTGTRPTFTDPLQAGLFLGQLLDDDSDPMLLVVDDVWTEDQLEPFSCGGASCRRLVTTRNRWILPVGASRVTVDRMSTDEATQLLVRDLPDPPPHLVVDVLAQTGRWPILLGLANRAAVKAVSYGTTAAGALGQLAERLSAQGPAAFDLEDPRRRGRAVATTIRAGLDLLPGATADRFADLVVFPEDADIPFAVLEVLWRATGQLTPSDVRRTCEALAELSLVLDYRPELGTIRLHDVIREYLIRSRPVGDVVALHGRLLDAAAALVAIDLDGGPCWWQLPEGHDYLVRHLVPQLAAAGRADALTELVTDLRWTLVRLCRHGPAAVRSDLSHAVTPVAAVLARAVEQNAHLLAPLNPPEALAAVMVSRLKIYPLRPLIDRYLLHLRTPYLANRWPLSDQPHPAFIRPLTGHADRVTGVAISRDGSWLATSSDDGTARIWDAATGTCRHTLTGHTDRVTGVAISPDDSWLATRGWGDNDDCAARIWDAASGACRHTVTGHTAAVTAMVISPDSGWLATSSDDGTARIWDAATGTCRHTLTGHTGAVTGVAISPDGSWLATTDWGNSDAYDGAAWTWDAATGTSLHVLAADPAQVTEVAIAPDGTWLATSSDDTTQIWDAATGTCRHILTGPAGMVTGIAIAWDGSWLATSSGDGTARIWDPATGTCRSILTGHADTVTAVAISPDGSWLATTSDDGTARIWTTARHEQEEGLPRHFDAVTGVAISPDGSWLATTSDDGTARIWDAATGSCRHTLTDRTERTWTSWLEAVAISPDGNWLATTSRDGTARIWDAATGTCRRTLTGHTNAVTAVAIAPDGNWLATTSGDGTARIWDAATGTCRHTLTDRTERTWTSWLEAVAISPDGNWLATTSGDDTARIWDAATGTCRRTLTGHANTVAAVAISPDGSWLATSSYDGTARIWDAARGTCRHTLTHIERTSKRWVNRVTISPDGSWLATTSGDGTARIWDAATGTCRHTLSGHTDGVTGVAISPDGSWLATTSSDGIARMYESSCARPRTVMRVRNVSRE